MSDPRQALRNLFPSKPVVVRQPRKRAAKPGFDGATRAMQMLLLIQILDREPKQKDAFHIAKGFEEFNGMESGGMYSRAREAKKLKQWLDANELEITQK